MGPMEKWDLGRRTRSAGARDLRVCTCCRVSVVPSVSQELQTAHLRLLLTHHPAQAHGAKQPWTWAEPLTTTGSDRHFLLQLVSVRHFVTAMEVHEYKLLCISSLLLFPTFTFFTEESTESVSRLPSNLYPVLFPPSLLSLSICAYCSFPGSQFLLKG